MVYRRPEPIYKPNESVPISSRDPVTYARGVDYHLMFTNLSDTTVYVLQRDGVVLEFPPEKMGHTHVDEFLIGKVYRAKGCRFSTGTAVDNDPRYMGYSEREELNRQIDHDKRHNLYDNYNRSYYLKYLFEPSLIRKLHAGCVYVVSLDIVISTDPPSEGVVHPATLHGTSNYFFERAHDTLSADGVSIVAIKIIDNFKHYGDQFVNVSGKVFRIKAVSDPQFPDGVYVYNTEADVIKPPEYYPFDKLNESGVTLYSSYELAATAGDPKSLYEDKLRKSKFEQETLKHEQEAILHNIKREYEQELLKTKTLEETNKRLQAEIDHQRKIERAEYERRKDRRNDQKEDTRWMMGLVTTIFSVAGAALATYATMQKNATPK